MIMKRLTPEDAYKALKENRAVYSIIQVEMTKGPMDVLDMIFGANDLITFEETAPDPEKKDEEILDSVDAGLQKSRTGRKPKYEKQTKEQADHGKIIALHNAGWPVAKIADEMGCTDQTVRNHIKREEQNDNQ